MLRHLIFISSLIFVTNVYALQSEFEQRIEKAQSMTDHQEVLQALSTLENEVSSPVEQSLINLAIAQRLIAKGDIPGAQKSAIDAADYAELQGFPEHVAKANKLEAITYYYLGDYEKAVDGYNATLVHYRMTNDYVQQANLLNNIALVNTRIAEYESALAAYSEAQALYQRYGSVRDQIDIKHNLAVLYINLRQFDNAIEYFEELLAWHSENSNQEELTQIYAEYSVPLKQAQQYDKALKFGLKARDYYQTTKNDYRLASTLHNLSEIQFELGNFEQAQAFAKESTLLAEKVGHQKALSGALYVLAKSYFASQDTANALSYLSKANDIAMPAKDEALVKDIAWLYAMIYANQGNITQSLASQKFAINKQYELSNTALNTKLARYQSKQLSQQINQLKQQQALNDVKAKQAFQYWLSLLLGVVLFGLLSFFIYSRNVERNANKQLKEKVEERTQKIDDLNRELARTVKLKKESIEKLASQIAEPLAQITDKIEHIVTNDNLSEECKSALNEINKDIAEISDDLR